MSNQSYSASQFGFAQLESTFGTIPNTGGTATVANANAHRLTKLAVNYTRPLIPRSDKTGQASAALGQYGRYGGAWTMSCDAAGSGTAGTPPDIDPYLTAAFGVKTVVPATSVAYSLQGLVAPQTLAIFNYRDPSTVEQWIAAGCPVSALKVPLNADKATLEFSGEIGRPISSVLFAGLSATGKCGLTTFPTRPSAPVFNGINALGFLNGISIDSVVYQTLTAGNIDITFNRELQKDTPGLYPSAPMQGLRSIKWSITLRDDDSAALIALKAKLGVTPVAVSIAQGAVAGNIWTWSSPNVLFDPPTMSDSKTAWELTLSGVAYPSTPSANDEIGLVLT